MANKAAFYKMYPKDFDTDEAIRLMDMQETGLYVLCLNHAWVNGGLPEDPQEIAFVLKIPLEEFRSVWPRVSALFHADGGRLVCRFQWGSQK